MAIPPNFNTWEHLQALLMSLQNRMVTEEFRDVEDLDNITTPRSSLKSACWLRDADTAIIALVKMFLFHVIIKNAEPDEIYGLISELALKKTGPRRKDRPKISLTFSSDPSEDPSNQIWRIISFRVMDQTSESFSQSDALALAQKIKSSFGTGRGFDWETGKTMYSYSDWDRGYQFQIMGKTDNDPKKLIDKVMALRNHTPNWTYFNANVNDVPLETYPNTPDTLRIMGETFREPARRPVGRVYFRWATLSLPPKKPVTLYDKTGRRFDPLVD